MSESYGEFEATQRGYGPGDYRGDYVDLDDVDIDLARLRAADRVARERREEERRDQDLLQVPRQVLRKLALAARAHEEEYGSEATANAIRAASEVLGEEI